MWEVEAKIKTFSFADKELLKGGCFSSDGNFIAFREKNNINVMDIATRKMVSVIKISENKTIHPIAFTKEGKNLMVEQGQVIDIYDISTPIGRLDHEITAEGTNHYFTKDDSYLVEAYPDNFKLVDMRTGKDIGNFAGQKDLKTIVLSQDNRFIASQNENKIKLWDSKTTKPVIKGITMSEKENIYCFSPDGRYILGGSDTLKFWEIRSGKELPTPIVSESKISKVTFSNDGKYIAVGDGKGVIRLWSINDETMAEIYYAREIENESKLISQKREFEKTDDYLKRKQKLLRSIRTKYLNQYLEKIGTEKTLQDQWVDEDEKREEEKRQQIKASRQNITLHIDSLGVYNADKETFAIHIVGDADNPYNRWEDVKVPLRDNAQCFKQKYQSLIVSAVKQVSENLKSFDVFNIKIRSSCSGRDKDYNFGLQRVLTEE